MAGITNGGIVGFKYFGFGGLSKDTKGVKAFEGTKKGDNTNIYVNLTHGRHGAFTIHVRLDDPWKGKEIATISVPENDQRASAIFGASVPAVEGLTGKHAIYLVAEGQDIQAPQQPQWGGRRQQQPQRPQGLFDLHGIGFSKGTERVIAPEVPQVIITVDGQKLNIPERPLMSTNQNGYTECNHYQLYVPLKADSKIETKATVPGVKFTVSPISDGRATIRATLGQEKVFLIN